MAGDKAQDTNTLTFEIKPKDEKKALRKEKVPEKTIAIRGVQETENYEKALSYLGQQYYTAPNGTDRKISVVQLTNALIQAVVDTAERNGWKPIKGLEINVHIDTKAKETYPPVSK